MRKGRQADSARRRQRVLDTIEQGQLPPARRSASPASPAPPPLTAPSSTGTATCWRKSTPSKPPRPPPQPAPGPGVTRTSLQADLLAAGERAIRLTARIRQLEKRLSEALGEQAWHEPGSAPPDIDALNQKITYLEQKAADLQLQLAERDQDLTAARAASRELMTRLNTRA